MTDEKPKPEEKKEKVVAKPLPVDKEKTKEIEKQLAEKKETPKEEKKPEEKKEEPKEPKKEAPKITKKEEAVVCVPNLPISKKHAVYICKFIKNKEIDKALSDLTLVSQYKKSIPYKGEIPHRKGKAMSGRYPIKATKYFINMLKSLKGNVIVNQMELEKTKIHIASATWGSRPLRSGGRSAKRTYVLLKAKEFPEKGGKK